MHLVFLNQYHPPDAAPTGVMLAAVAEELAAHGHEVTVISAEGGYADIEHRKSNVGHRTSDVENGAQTKKDDPPRGGPASRDEVGRPGPSDPTVLRIRATRFGRGTFLGKVADYLSYYLGVAWKLMFLRPGPDRIVALTTPPYLSVLARVFSKIRGGDHAHWVMDLYPDVMVAHGMLREGSLAHRLLAGLARWGFGGRRCAALLTLGPDMAERMGGGVSVVGCRLSEDHGKSDPAGAGPAARDQVGRPGPSDPTWVPLWSDAPEEMDGMGLAKCRHARGWRDDELVVMYSGNMGLGHRFGEILEIAVGLDCQAGPLVASGVGSDRDAQENPEDTLQSRSAPAGTSGRAPAVTPYRAMTRFVFFGGGKRRGEIERFVAEHPGAPVELHDYAPAEDLGIHLRSADVHLASLAAEWTGTMVPSKLQGIFHAARPVIFIGDAGSSIGRWVAESGGGWVVAPGDVAALERAIGEARDPEVRETRGRAAKAFAERNFDKATNVRRVAEVLAECLHEVALLEQVGTNGKKLNRQDAKCANETPAEHS